jgi:hypothetical protein
MIDQNKLDRVAQVAKTFLNDHPEQRRQFELEDLINETVGVLLEGYRGNKVEGETKFAVYHAAERLSRVECQEMTGHDFSTSEGSSPSGRRNTEDDFVQQLEIDDWRANKLDGYQNDIVTLLLAGHNQEDIARRLGVAQQTISRRVAEIQELAKEDFDVN